MTATTVEQKKTACRHLKGVPRHAGRRSSDRRRCVAERVATGASYAVGAATSIFGTLTANEIAAYGGLLIAFLTFVVNAVFKYLTWKINKRLAETKIKSDDSGG